MELPHCNTVKPNWTIKWLHHAKKSGHSGIPNGYTRHQFQTNPIISNFPINILSIFKKLMIQLIAIQQEACLHMPPDFLGWR
jgi:hypothetical protein